MGNGREALENLLFFTPPGEVAQRVETVERQLEAGFDSIGPEGQERCLRFLIDLALSLSSSLTRWSLQSGERHGISALGDSRSNILADAAQALASGLAARAPAASGRLLAVRRRLAAARFEAEGSPEPAREAAALVGVSIEQYLTGKRSELAGSHLRRLAEMRFSGQTLTECSNDYAAFLQQAMYLGASFATTNPPLVDMAWLADRVRWDAVIDEIVAKHPNASNGELARLVTLEIVLDNMLLLRPVFLITGGAMGCVCLQVNPHNHDDAEAMISDGLDFYDRLEARVGGVPNVVFKLPGTKAGMAACRALTRRCIGVTITVGFGMFQHLPFAEAIVEGQDIFSNLVEMNGRLAFPVRDQLLGRLDELAAHGIDERRAREAAAWAGVAVIKRLHRLLSKRGYDLRRLKLLVASLRIYRGSEYEGLPSAFPDITEVLGTGILSVFPNVRRPYDRLRSVRQEPTSIEAPVPDDALAVLAHSEIFRQAYYIGDPAWAQPGDEQYRPDVELTLNDEQAVAAWPPVRDTLAQFQNAYDAFVWRILERKAWHDERM